MRDCGGDVDRGVVGAYMFDGALKISKSFRESRSGSKGNPNRKKPMLKSLFSCNCDYFEKHWNSLSSTGSVFLTATNRGYLRVSLINEMSKRHQIAISPNIWNALHRLMT